MHVPRQDVHVHVNALPLSRRGRVLGRGYGYARGLMQYACEYARDFH